MEFFSAVINVLDSTIRVSVPLLLACLAGLYSERAGIFDIGLEGKMLAGAFAGAAAAAVSGSAWIGLVMADRWSRSGSRSCTALPRSPIAATRSYPASPSTSSPPARPSSSARPGSARAGARRQLPAERALRAPSACRVRRRASRDLAGPRPIYSETDLRATRCSPMSPSWPCRSPGGSSSAPASG